MDIAGPTAGKQHLDGEPARAAQRSQDIKEDGHGAVVNLVGAFHPWLVNQVAQHRHAPFDRQRRHRAPVVYVQMENRAAQCRTDIRRVLEQLAKDAQGGGSAPLSDQQAEMGTLRPRRAPLQQPAHGGEGNRVLGIFEQAQIKADTADRFRRINPQFPQNLGNLDERANPQPAFIDGAFLWETVGIPIDRGAMLAVHL